MTDKVLDADVTGTSGLQVITVNQSHDSSCAMANITCLNTTLDVGDAVEVELGYIGDTIKVFQGYVKVKETKTPDGIITLTAHDDMTRAVDYFIVSDDPEHGYTYKNITAHALIQTVLEMAGLDTFDFDNTFFTFGIENDFEVNLVSSYDYARMISDIIAWMVWSDRTGTIKLKNRKPYPMDGGSGQPGDVADVIIATLIDSGNLEINDSLDEKDLRNKVVVYGAENLYEEADQATSYNPITDAYEQVLPVDYYKAIVLASPLIDDATFAQKACDYNLALYNRLTWTIPLIVEGNGLLEARKVVRFNSAKLGINEDFYIYQCEHSWGKQGYTTSLLLRK